MMKPTWLLCAVIAVAYVWLTPAELAAQYRWVDRDGTVHYSQFPPPASEVPKDSAVPDAAPRDPKVAAFSLAGVKYFHRFTKADLHEYTPEGQEDLKAWTDMTTIHYYRNVKDADALAAVANAVLGNYQANRAKIVRTDSVPKTKDKPAEHLIVALFGRPEFFEAAFARFRMHGGVGTAVIYSHRVYGDKAGIEMGKWLEQKGADTEKNLLKWAAMPTGRRPGASP